MYDEIKKEKIFKELDVIYKHVIAVSDTSHIPSKYLDKGIHRKCISYYDLLYHFKNHMRYKKGLDFGCAIAVPTVMGKKLDLDITGMDVDKYKLGYGIDKTKVQKEFHTAEKEFSLPYISLLNTLGEWGYPIDVFDTNQFPWNQCRDNEFDFVIGSGSICKNTKVDNNSNAAMHDKLIHRRIKEILRITKNQGSWYITPDEHYKIIVNNPLIQLENPKQISIYSIDYFEKWFQNCIRE